MNCEIGRFRIRRGRARFREGPPVRLDEGAVARAVDTLEIDAGAQVPGAGFGTDLEKLRFGQAATRDRDLASLVEPAPRGGSAKRPEKFIGRYADQRVEHKVRTEVENLVDDRGEISLADCEVALRQHCPACSYDCLAHDFIVFPGPDVIRANAKSAPAAVLQDMFGKRHDMLVRRGPGVDDVLAALETFVMRWVPQQSVVFFEEGQNLLAARRSVAADDVYEPVLREHLLRRARIARVSTAGVDFYRIDRERECRVAGSLLRRRAVRRSASPCRRSRTAPLWRRADRYESYPQPPSVSPWAQHKKRPLGEPKGAVADVEVRDCERHGSTECRPRASSLEWNGGTPPDCRQALEEQRR